MAIHSIFLEFFFEFFFIFLFFLGPNVQTSGIYPDIYGGNWGRAHLADDMNFSEMHENSNMYVTLFNRLNVDGTACHLESIT